MIVFPKNANKPKKADTPKDQQSAETTRSIRTAFAVTEAVAPGFSEVSKGSMPKGPEGGAYKALRKARSDAKLVGVREKRAKEKAEAEANKK